MLSPRFCPDFLLFCFVLLPSCVSCLFAVVLKFSPRSLDLLSSSLKEEVVLSSSIQKSRKHDKSYQVINFCDIHFKLSFRFSCVIMPNLDVLCCLSRPGWSFPELYTQSEEEILSPDDDQDFNQILERQQRLNGGVKGLTRPSFLLSHHPSVIPASESGIIHPRISYSSHQFSHPFQCRDNNFEVSEAALHTIESSSEVSSQTSSQIRSLYDSRRRSLEIRRDLAPLLLRTYSHDSMSDILAPKFKAKAPKNSEFLLLLFSCSI